MNSILIYLPVFTWFNGAVERTIWIQHREPTEVENPILFQRLNSAGQFDFNSLHEATPVKDWPEIMTLTPMVVVKTQNLDLAKFGLEEIADPTDDPWCGSCGKMCLLKWQYDSADDGRWAWGVSDCCKSNLFVDPLLILEWHPDADAYGAWEPDDSCVDLDAERAL